MSRLQVRNAIRTELNNWATANGVVFHDTINDEHSVADNEWCTVEFFCDYIEKLCYEAKSVKETGTIDITVFTRAGQGDSRAVQLCDSVQDHFYNITLTDIEIVDTVSASEINAGNASGKFFGCAVSLTYNYYY